jgi:RNA recognition motif-containing protein
MSNKLWVGSLPAGTEGAELEEVFAKFGRIRKVWVARNPPGFAFVEVCGGGRPRRASLRRFASRKGIKGT